MSDPIDSILSDTFILLILIVTILFCIFGSGTFFRWRYFDDVEKARMLERRRRTELPDIVNPYYDKKRLTFIGKDGENYIYYDTVTGKRTVRDRFGNIKN